MLDSGTLLGAPRLAFLDADKATVLFTLYLPYPDKDGGVQVSESWAKGIHQSLLNGGVRFIPGGVRLNATITWGLYDPTYTRKPIGVEDGSTPELLDLYSLIAAYNNGRLLLSPCSNRELWFRVACTSDMKLQTTYPAAFGNASLTFEGLDQSDTAAAFEVGE